VQKYTSYLQKDLGSCLMLALEKRNSASALFVSLSAYNSLQTGVLDNVDKVDYYNDCILFFSRTSFFFDRKYKAGLLLFCIVPYFALEN
jgi:hypothetical protein